MRRCCTYLGMRTLRVLAVTLACGCVSNTNTSSSTVADVGTFPPTTGSEGTATSGADTVDPTAPDSTSNVDTGGGSVSETGAGDSTGTPMCDTAQTLPYTACEGLCTDACTDGMLCVVDSIDPNVGVGAAICAEVCTRTPDGDAVDCSPTMYDPPFDVPTCQHFLCVIPCVGGACPADYMCVSVGGAESVDICMPEPLM